MLRILPPEIAQCINNIKTVSFKDVEINLFIDYLRKVLFCFDLKNS